MDRLEVYTYRDVRMLEWLVGRSFVEDVSPPLPAAVNKAFYHAG